ncbi:MAG: phage portal protein [Kiritimatiellales bacterium]
MGLFQKLFGFVKIRYVYAGSSAKSAPFNKEIYEQETVRSVIDCIASHTAKAEAMHVVLDKEGRIKEIKRNSPYSKLLNLQPNGLMTGYDLKYKLISHLENNTISMCYIKWGGKDNMQPVMMIPVAMNSFEICPIDTGGYAVKFVDDEGTERALPIEDVVLLRKFFNRYDVAGDGNDAITDTLTMIKATNASLLDAVTVSNKIRGIIKQKKAMLDGDDVKLSQQSFAERYSAAAVNGGVVGIDSMEEYTPLSVTPWSANAMQMKEIRDSILRYWRTSDDILMSDYTEDQFRAWFESVIEPRLIQMGQAFTNACFTQGEKDAGNRIIFNTSILMNTSMQTKTNLVTISKEIGLFTKNQILEMFGYAPVEGGDVAQVSLNYVKETDQSKYQTGNEPADKPEAEDPAAQEDDNG